MIPAKADSVSILDMRQKGVDAILEWLELHPSFYALGWCYLGNQPQVEELFYQAILKVQKKLPRFKNHTSFETWVTSIFIHICRELSQSRSPGVSKEIEYDPYLKALNRLEETEKEVLLLTYVRGIPRVEGAQVLSLCAEQMKELSFSGIQSLNKEMGEGAAFNGCREYQKDYIHYLERTMDRPQKIEFEKHIYHCPGCQEDLGSFQEVMLYLMDRVDHILVPAGFIENIKKRLIERGRGKQRKNKHRTKAGLLITGVFAFLIGTGYFTGAFSFLYYKWSEDNPELRASLQQGIGERLNLKAKSKGIIIKIKGVIADDFQTIVYYEIEDTKKDHQYALNFDEGVRVENGYKIMKSDDSPRIYPPDFKRDLNIKEKNVYDGKISLPPLAKDQGTIKLQVTKLLKLSRNSSNQLDSRMYEDLKPKVGKWDFTIPVTKQPSIEYAVNKKRNIEGITVLIDKLILAPTTTILNYEMVNTLNEKQIDSLNFDHMEVDKKKVKPDLYGFSFADPINENASQASFDPLPGERPKELKIKFGSVSSTVYNNKTIELDAFKTYPQTVEYAGSKISIDKQETGKAVTIIISNHEIKQRKYDSLQVDVINDVEDNANVMETDMEGVYVDKKGAQYDPNKLPISYEDMEQPRYFTTVQSIKLENDNNQKVTPKKLEIYGYNTMKYLDDVVKIKLGKGTRMKENESNE
ncbi:DUF4179 domain-containing protein [Peribacillus kribbensis]|uniref:DUF4179 domain-containing protein n=1 Tax=Peribacillus kribbensis TaxID=356658 RepID=UPI00041628E5|nr:DUF4179 domain-containing protein [Peribacillus kribbensis]